MLTWNETFLIFNDSVIQSSTARRDYNRKRLTARSSEARRYFTSRQYFQIDLSGIQLSPAQFNEIRAFESQLYSGDTDVFLVRLSTHCLFENEITGARNNLSYEPCFLGQTYTNGQQFQLQKKYSIQGRPAYVDDIHYPNYNYPPLEDLNGEDWVALPPLQLWNGKPLYDEITRTWSGSDVTASCTVDRNLGLVTPSGVSVNYVTGGFFWKMILTSSIPVRPMGAGYYEMTDNIAMVEPYPEGGEIPG